MRMMLRRLTWCIAVPVSLTLAGPAAAQHRERVRLWELWIADNWGALNCRSFDPIGPVFYDVLSDVGDNLKRDHERLRGCMAAPRAFDFAFVLIQASSTGTVAEVVVAPAELYDLGAAACLTREIKKWKLRARDLEWSDALFLSSEWVRWPCLRIGRRRR